MPPDNPPLVTIGITSYNARPTVGRAVASALAQEYPNKEILVVDDGSTDGSQEYLQALAAQHPLIRVVLRGRNGGCAAARNTLIEEARGEYICFFDDDDESFPTRLGAQYDRLSSFRANAPVFCFVTRIVRRNEDPATDVPVLSIGHAAPEPSGGDYIDYIFLNAGNPAFSWGQSGIGTCMARRFDFVRSGGFDETFRRGEEWDFFVRAAMKGAHFISVATPQMIQHITHTEDKAGRAALDFALKLRHIHKGYLKERSLYAASLCAARARFAYAKGNGSKSVLWTAAACLLSPGLVLKYHLGRKLGGMVQRLKRSRHPSAAS